MPKDLERDLGLYATITISVGAMVGSGIFVLPLLAAKKAGPGVVLAYLLAGLVVLPAALSKAEMATAIPESGGTYLFIDRAMGPLPGTIAGIGAWFSLAFKSAFALVGLGAYLLLLVDISAGLLTVVSLGLGVLLVGVNLLGVKQTGRLQAGIVSFVLVVLAVFVADGTTYVDGARYHPFLTHGSDGLFAATGFVFVSYAGVTKVASVAEEVEDPGTNIPRAMLGSIVAMMLVYTLTVFVVVGVVPADRFDTLTPMAVAASAFAGRAGELAVAAVAVLALASMANAGVLSASRYPLAMSRDSLAPSTFEEVSERFRTPTWSIAFTGAILLALLAFVPVVDLAKLASAFQLLVFAFVNVALVAFRESDLDWYEPAFTAPGYPWAQVAGTVGSLALLRYMGGVALSGAVGIVAVGLIWYRLYGRDRTDREGAALDAIRRSTGDTALARTEEIVAGEGARNRSRAGDGSGGKSDEDVDVGVLVAVDGDTSAERERTLLTVAASVVGQRDGVVHAVRFEEVPEQLSLSSATEMRPEDEAFEARTRELAASLSTDVEPCEIVSHDTKRAVCNFARDVDAELLLGACQSEGWHAELLGEDVDWFVEHAPCRVVFLQDRGFDDVAEVGVLTHRGPYDPFEVAVADAIATATGAAIRFVAVVDADATDELVASKREFHDDLGALCSVPTESTVVPAAEATAALTEAASDADAVILGTTAHSRLYELLFGDPVVEVGDRLDCSVLFAHSPETKGETVLRALVEKLAY